MWDLSEHIIYKAFNCSGFSVRGFLVIKNAQQSYCHEGVRNSLGSGIPRQVIPVTLNKDKILREAVLYVCYLI